MGADKLAEYTPNVPKIFVPICPPKPKSLEFLKKNLSLGVRSLCTEWSIWSGFQIYQCSGYWLPCKCCLQIELLVLACSISDLISQFDARWDEWHIGKLETDFESVWNVFMLCNIYPFIQQLSNSRVVTCTNAPLLVAQWGEILSEESLFIFMQLFFTKYSWKHK